MTVNNRTEEEVSTALKMLDKRNKSVHHILDSDSESDSDRDRGRKRRRKEEDPLLCALEHVLGLDPDEVKLYRESWSTAEYLLTPHLWFRMFERKPVTWSIDIVEGESTLDGTLIRQLRSLLQQQFPSATSNEISGVVNDWKLAYQLYMSMLQLTSTAKIAPDWLAFFDRHLLLIAEWRARINSLVDHKLTVTFGEKAVAALQASRSLR